MTEQYPRTALFGTEERTLFCSTVGREYHLSVALPDGYKTSNQAYPVIYVLDGDVYFGMTVGLTTIAGWFKRAPEAIIVGMHAFFFFFLFLEGILLGLPYLVKGP